MRTALPANAIDALRHLVLLRFACNGTITL